MMGCSGSPDEGKQIGANPYWLSYPPKDESVKVTFVALSFCLYYCSVQLCVNYLHQPKYVYTRKNLSVTDSSMSTIFNTCNMDPSMGGISLDNCNKNETVSVGDTAISLRTHQFPAYNSSLTIFNFESGSGVLLTNLNPKSFTF